MLGDKCSGFGSLAEHNITTHDNVFVREHFVFPIFNTGMELDFFTVAGGTEKSCPDL